MALYERIFWAIMGVATAAIVTLALIVMLDMEASSRSQGGRFYVAIGALVAFVAIDRVCSKLVYRFAPFDIGTSAAERRFAILTLVLGLMTAAVLFGAALLLP